MSFPSLLTLFCVVIGQRDRDLELAARIGQSLLQRNHLLQERNEAVEEQLTQAIDQVHQLQHELAKKDELLRMVASASEESESDTSCSAPHPLLQRPPGGGVSTAAAALSQLEVLQGKLEELEEENQALRSELSHKGEEVLRHQEEISQLLSQIVELQHHVKELALEKEELRVHLLASKDVQRQLTCELNELTERSAECVAMLHEAQEEVKEQRGKNSLTGGLRRHLSCGLYPMVSSPLTFNLSYGLYPMVSSPLTFNLSYGLYPMVSSPLTFNLSCGLHPMVSSPLTFNLSCGLHPMVSSPLTFNLSYGLYPMVSSPLTFNLSCGLYPMVSSPLTFNLSCGLHPMVSSPLTFNLSCGLYPMVSSPLTFNLSCGLYPMFTFNLSYGLYPMVSSPLTFNLSYGLYPMVSSPLTFNLSYGLYPMLSHKGEEVLRHQEEISQLLSQILALEKEELRVHLLASKDVQRQLTCELNELTERSAECVAMLHEAQEEVKEQRGKNSLTGGLRRHLSCGLYPMDSLAAEIEGTMRRELSVDEESAFRDQRTSQKRVFQTVRSVNTMAPRASSPALPGSPTPSTASRCGDTTSCGAPEEGGGPEAGGAGGEEGEEEEGGAGSGRSSHSNLSELSVVFKTFLPEKLQIVKPMEGSLTLHHWQQLAKPHLATVLDPHPGVVTKAFRPLPQDLHLSSASAHHLDDLEEDEEERPGGWRCGPAEEEEKGSSERGKADKKDKGEEEEEEDEEEGGIVFQVRVSSTPEDRKERSTLLKDRKELPEGRKELKLPEDCKARSPVPGSPLAASRDPLSLFRPLAAVGAASFSSSADLAAPPARAPLTSAASGPVQSQDQMVASAAAAAILSSVQHPGKCLSSTFSTCTVTTCRILHPSDITQVTSSSQPMWSVGPPHTPSSMRTGPSTPVTPCRLSLGAGSSPPRRPATPLAAAAAAAGLAKLVLERGISAAPRPAPHPAPADNFLASRPAELFLQDVYGLNLGRAPPHPDLPSPAPDPPSTAPQSGGAERPDPVSVGLVERLCRLGFGGVLQGPSSSSTFVAAGGGSLLDGLRRNQSLPAMMGAGPGARRPPQTPPASLAPPPPPWGVDAKQPHRRGRVSSFTQPSSSSSSSSSSQSRKH
ncbi:LOW QUALITY PROTEIN: hypothetical protein CRUP_002250 [Coryphaenoides rupestris]|nr:LOW QUALITY PROTEIN: hypothetical protein CRUP_002250 [Coryphaenoides rupestris]